MLTFTLAARDVVFAQDKGQATEPPVVEVKALTSRDALERGESGQLFVAVSNKSSVPLRGLRLSIMTDAFVVPEPRTFPLVSGFGSVSELWTVRPTNDAEFAQHTLIVNAEYGWSDGEQEFVSAQTSTVAIKVKRRFEDELGGLLGGGAAAIYFLLPFIVAVATFKVVEQLRKGETPQFPAFGPQHLIPGAIASVAVNALVQLLFLLFHRDYAADLLDPANFLLVAGISIVVGALVPGILWGLDWWRGWRWSYTGCESTSELLRKALRGPRGARHDWVTLKSDGVTWEGMLLEEDRDRFVLGSQLQATALPEKIDSIEREVLQEDGTVLDPARLVKSVKAGEIAVTPRRRVVREEETREEPQVELVKIVERQELQRREQRSEPLIRLAK